MGRALCMWEQSRVDELLHLLEKEGLALKHWQPDGSWYRLKTPCQNKVVILFGFEETDDGWKTGKMEEIVVLSGARLNEARERVYVSYVDGNPRFDAKRVVAYIHRLPEFEAYIRGEQLGFAWAR